MNEQTCPLCRSAKRMRRKRLLYGTPVCRRCCNGFASRRQLGYIVDTVIWWPIAFSLALGLEHVLSIAPMDATSVELTYVGFTWLLFPMLFFCKDSFSGCSPGKWICGVRVVTRDDLEPIGVGSSFKRNLPLIVPLIPLVIAFLLLKGYRLGDGWANSKVIWRKYANHPVFTGLFACQVCQFDLTGNVSGTCPECGTPIPDHFPA